ncbi:MAG: DUF6262 family protein [Pleurocapsa sp.]
MKQSDRLKKRITGLKNASEKKKQTALIRTNQAIDKLIQSKEKITIRSVAREARVSVSYLYKYPEISYKIKTLRDAQKYDKDSQIILLDRDDKPVENNKNATDKLIEENACLKAYIKKIEGNKKSTSELKKENANLQIENEKLKQELKFARQNLAEVRDFILSQGYDDTQDKIKLQTRERVVKQIT